MADPEVTSSRQPRKSGLQQSKLAPAFFKHNGETGTTSPYFTRPPPTELSEARNERHDRSLNTRLGALDLHPEHRSNLPSPPLTLPSPLASGRSTMLAHIAAETKALLPYIVKTVPNASPNGIACNPSNLSHLNPRYCPRLPRTSIRVVNSDTIDAAISLSSMTAATAPTPTSKPPLVLNMANAYHSGGGWLQGSLAQEEALCYRSSLSMTLKNRFYPIPEAGGIYSPTVVVIRESMAQGHKFLDLAKPEKLPLISVVSVAAVRGPKIARDVSGAERYQHQQDRETMKEKIRVVLRTAAIRKHRELVLGALGCGAFGNPRGEVVQCWKEVFNEAEFRDGWWDTILFAVMEPKGQANDDGNFGVFFRGLNGIKV